MPPVEPRRPAKGPRRATGADRVLQLVRKLCLSLPDTTETASWGHPNFRAGKRTFLAFEWIKGRPSIAFRLEPVDVDLLLRRKQFFLTPYGRGQWVSAWADGPIDWRLVRRLVLRSQGLVLGQRAKGKGKVKGTRY